MRATETFAGGAGSLPASASGSGGGIDRARDAALGLKVAGLRRRVGLRSGGVLGGENDVPGEGEEGSARPIPGGVSCPLPLELTGDELDHGLDGKDPIRG